MTDDTVVICRRCGFGNTPGDQFCGSCGAFLEWEGEKAVEPGATASADAETAALAAMAGGPDAADAPTQVWRPAPAVTPAPVITAPQPAPPSDAGLLRCPACGIANPATRTFCLSCGATLGGATRHAERSAAAIAAAVEAVPGRAPTSAVPPASPAAASRPAAPKSRGIPGWLFALVGLGIVAGVAIVLGSMLLKGEAPATGASAAPVSPGASAPAQGDASAAPGQSAAPGESAGPSAPGRLVLTGATASSVVGDRAKFQPEMAIDDDPKTAWQEGKKTEKGQWIEVTLAPSRVESLQVWAGYQASKALYRGNLRPKDILVSVNGQELVKVRLKDVMKPQTIELGDATGVTSLRITILSTYASKKTSVDGSPFDDAAISEIRLIGVAGG